MVDVGSIRSKQRSLQSSLKSKSPTTTVGGRVTYPSRFGGGSRIARSSGIAAARSAALAREAKATQERVSKEVASETATSYKQAQQEYWKAVPKITGGIQERQQLIQNLIQKREDIKLSAQGKLFAAGVRKTPPDIRQAQKAEARIKASLEKLKRGEISRYNIPTKETGDVQIYQGAGGGYVVERPSGETMSFESLSDVKTAFGMEKPQEVPRLEPPPQKDKGFIQKVMDTTIPFTGGKPLWAYLKKDKVDTRFVTLPDGTKVLRPELSTAPPIQEFRTTTGPIRQETLITTGPQMEAPVVGSRDVPLNATLPDFKTQETFPRKETIGVQPSPLVEVKGKPSTLAGTLLLDFPEFTGKVAGEIAYQVTPEGEIVMKPSEIPQKASIPPEKIKGITEDFKWIPKTGETKVYSSKELARGIGTVAGTVAPYYFVPSPALLAGGSYIAVKGTTPERRFAGATLAAFGAAGTGYRGYKFLKTPVIKPRPVKPTYTGFIDVSRGKGKVELGKFRIEQRTPAQYADVWKSRIGKYLGKKPEKVLVKKPKLDVTWTPDPIITMEGKIIEPAAFVTKTQTKGKGYTKIFELRGGQEPVTAESFSQLPKTQQYVFKKIMEKRFDQPIPLKDVYKYMKRDLFYTSGQLEAGYLGKVRVKGKRVDVRFPRKGRRTTFQEIGTVSRKIGETPELEIFTGVTAGKEIKTALPRAAGKVDMMTGTSIKFKDPFAPSETVIDFGGLQQTQRLTGPTSIIEAVAKTAKTTLPKVRPYKAPKPPKPSALISPATITATTLAPLVPKTKVKTTQMSQVKPVEKLFSLQAPLVSLSLKEDQLLKQVPKEKQIPKEAVTLVQKQTPKVKQAQKINFGQVQRLKQVQKMKTQQALKLSFRFQTPKPPKTPPPKTPVIIPPIPSPFFNKKNFKKPKKPIGLFVGEIRRYGKWKPVTKPTKFGKAFGIAKKKVTGTLAASLRVKKTTGELVKLPKAPKFRLGKRDPFILVQRKPFRLAFPSEKREIQAERKKLRGRWL